MRCSVRQGGRTRRTLYDLKGFEGNTNHALYPIQKAKEFEGGRKLISPTEG